MSLSIKNFIIEIQLPFENERISRIVYDVIKVDKEPKRSRVIKSFNLSNRILIGKFISSSAKQLRLTLNNTFEKVDLILGTIETVGPPVTISDEYSYY